LTDLYLNFLNLRINIEQLKLRIMNLENELNTLKNLHELNMENQQNNLKIKSKMYILFRLILKGIYSNFYIKIILELKIR
jgi:hypothetical protein